MGGAHPRLRCAKCRDALFRSRTPHWSLRVKMVGMPCLVTAALLCFLQLRPQASTTFYLYQASPDCSLPLPPPLSDRMPPPLSDCRAPGMGWAACQAPAPNKHSIACAAERSARSMDPPGPDAGVRQPAATAACHQRACWQAVLRLCRRDGPRCQGGAGGEEETYYVSGGVP